METETGIQFLSRINIKPVANLGRELFPVPLEPPQVIEVSGPPSVGKSLLCLDLVIATLFPKTLFGISLGGLESSVIFIDCDHHFNILHLADMMERRIKRLCHEARAELKKIGSEKDHELMTIKKRDYNAKIENTIKSCLKNLIYFNCTSSSQFATTLLSLEHCLVNNTKVSLVIVDSISAFYWYDRIYKVENWHKMESYLNGIFQNFLSTIRKHYLICICTKQDLFKKRKDRDDNQGLNIVHNESLKAEDAVAYEYLGKEWTNGVTIRINMSFYPNQGGSLLPQNCNTDLSCALVETLQKKSSKTIICSFHEDGIRWVKADTIASEN